MGTQAGAVWADAALTTPPLIRNTGEHKLETAWSQQHHNHSPGIQELSYRQKKKKNPQKEGLISSSTTVLQYSLMLQYSF